MQIFPFNIYPFVHKLHTFDDKHVKKFAILHYTQMLDIFVVLIGQTQLLFINLSPISQN